MPSLIKMGDDLPVWLGGNYDDGATRLTVSEDEVEVLAIVPASPSSQPTKRLKFHCLSPSASGRLKLVVVEDAGGLDDSCG